MEDSLLFFTSLILFSWKNKKEKHVKTTSKGTTCAKPVGFSQKCSASSVLHCQITQIKVGPLLVSVNGWLSEITLSAGVIP